MHALMDDSKSQIIQSYEQVSTTDMCGFWFGSITSSKTIAMDILLWLPHKNCMVGILIGCKYCVRHLNKRY